MWVEAGPTPESPFIQPGAAELLAAGESLLTSAGFLHRPLAPSCGQALALQLLPAMPRASDAVRPQYGSWRPPALGNLRAARMSSMGAGAPSVLGWDGPGVLPGAVDSGTPPGMATLHAPDLGARWWSHVRAHAHTCLNVGKHVYTHRCLHVREHIHNMLI